MLPRPAARSTCRAETIFSDYAYFSSYSDSWVEHARRYVDAVSERFDLGTDSLVVEVASNDGYLLQHFVGRDVPVLGVEPARNVADVGARARGPDGERVPRPGEWHKRSLRITASRISSSATTCSPTCPISTTSLQGSPPCSRPTGVADTRVPALGAADRAGTSSTRSTTSISRTSRFIPPSASLARHGLAVFDVEELPTPRRLAAHLRPATTRRPQAVTAAVGRLAKREVEGGLDDASPYYDAFGRRWRRPSAHLLEFLIARRARGQDGRRLRGARQGQHAAQLLRHPNRPARVHGRPEPVQAGSLPAGHAHPDPTRPSGSPRRGPTTC